MNYLTDGLLTILYFFDDLLTALSRPVAALLPKKPIPCRCRPSQTQRPRF